MVVAFIMRGRDSNHIDIPVLRVCKSLFLVGPDYHALHHMYPTHFHGSWTKLIDYILGTASIPIPARVIATPTLRSRKFTLPLVSTA